MEMSGEQRIPAPREVVWEALNNPEVLRASIPGCEELERNEADDGFDAKVRVKVGPVNARFGGTVVLSDINPPESYTISGEGKGGSAGFAKGSARVTLTEEGDATLLSYSVDARVGGKLAQLGSRLIDGTARKMANDFFTRFSEIVKEQNGAAAEDGGADTPARADADTAQEAAALLGSKPAEEPPTEAAADRPASAGTTRSRGLPPLVWLAGLVLAIAILLAFVL